jgi:HK97 family phage portal protein
VGVRAAHYHSVPRLLYLNRAAHTRREVARHHHHRHPVPGRQVPQAAATGRGVPAGGVHQQATVSLFGAILDAVAPGRDTSGPPVEFTTATHGHGFSFERGSSRSAQLDLTTSESTLFSVLDLLSTSTASVEWNAYRKAGARRNPEQEPEEISGDQNLAVKLWHKPNPFMTGTHLRSLCQWHRDAVGEAYMVVKYFDGTQLPQSWWPVRPDRIKPVPDPDKFLIGYMYTGPDGTKVPLELHEVLRIIGRPHPTDPHRGIGAVQALLTALGTSMSAQQWIATFFQNDATPGGIIELGEGLEDHEFRKLVRRWNEQHRGVSRAHRVAILEYGKWTPRSINMKDMQFTELRTLTRDQILEAYRIHKHMLGASDDVNLANAQAADGTFAKWSSVPRLGEWKALANGPYVELFGETGIEFEFESPIQEDGEENRKDLESRVNAALRLIGEGADWDRTLETFGLPALPRVQAEETTPGGVGGDGSVPAQDPQPEPALDDSEKLTAAAVGAQKIYLATEGNTFLSKMEARKWSAAMGAPIVPEDFVEPEKPEPPAPLPGLPVPAAPAGPAVPEPAPPEQTPPPPGPDALANRRMTNAASPADEVDLSGLDEEWRRAVEDALTKWQRDVLPGQYAALVEQVQAAVDSDNLDQLAALVAPDAGGEELLAAALVAIAAVGSASVVREAAAQGVTVAAVSAPSAMVKMHAKVVAGLMGAALATSAGREGLRAAGPGVAGSVVADAVRTHLEGLTDAQPRQYLGGALTAAVNAGRMATMTEAPAASYVASEVLDQNTCTPCNDVHGTVFSGIGAAWENYPMGGFKDCLGLERCRGTVVAVWPKEGEDA